MRKNLAPKFDEVWVRRNFFRFEREEYWKNWVGKIGIRNAEKVHEASWKLPPPYFYLANHQSFLDYFIFNYAILKKSLPYPRSLAGDNLNNFFVRNLVWNFKKWGVIWTPREKGGEDFVYSEMKDYTHSLETELKNGRSLFGFPEGGRNRHPEGDLLKFKVPLFRTIMRIQQDLLKSKIPEERKLIKAVYVAAKYEKVPETDFWEKIDRSGKKGFSYYYNDIIAYLRWRYFEKDKGNVIVSFSEPVRILDVRGEGSIRKKAENFAAFSCEKIKKLKRDIE